MNTDIPVSSEPAPSVEGAGTDRNLAERRLALAIWKAQHNQPDAARSLFQEALQLNPVDVSIRLAYADFLAQQKHWLAAKRELTWAIEADREATAAWLNNELQYTPDAASLLYLRALLQTQLGQYVDARESLEQLLGLVPDQGQIFMDQAVLQEAMDDWDTAEHSYQAALQIDGNNIPWLIAYGTFLERRERDKDALRVLEHALSLNPDEVALQAQVEQIKQNANRETEARKRAALARFRLDEQGNITQAAMLIDEALKLWPDCALAHLVQADILERTNSLSRAERHLVRAIELEPDNAEYQAAHRAFQLRMAQKQQQVQLLISRAQAVADKEAALAWLDEALELIADDVETHLTYATLLWPNHPADAETHLQAALAVEPQHLEVNKKYITLLLSQNRRSEAEQYFHKSLESQPQDEELIERYVGWLIEQGRYEEALNFLKTAQQRVPMSALLQGQLAVVLARLNRFEEALPQFEAALQLEDVPSGLLHFEYARALRASNEQAKAEEYFRHAIEFNYDTPDLHCEYATLLLEQQRYAETQFHIQRAQTLHPDDQRVETVAKMFEEQFRQFEPVEAELAYAALLRKQGQIDEAEQALNRARSLAPNNVIVLREYGKFLESQDRLDQAVAILEQATALMPTDQSLKTEYETIQAKLQPPIWVTPSTATDQETETLLSPTVGASDRPVEVPTDEEVPPESPEPGPEKTDRSWWERLSRFFK